jgi:nitroreductase
MSQLSTKAAYRQPVTELIRQRFSCRSYRPLPIEQGTRDQLAALAASIPAGPFGTDVRFVLLAATEEDRGALRGLGTYGFIKGATAFLVGAAPETHRNLEDFGFLMECLLLHATDLGLGTCWLGGTFTKSRFAERISLRPGETVPAISAVGYMADRRGITDSLVRQQAGSDRRLAWERLFFEKGFSRPLSREAAGAYAVPLEMARLGPSASNRQPWRIVHEEGAWHFCLRRTSGYRDNPLMKIMDIADMQRIDMGIALCHFELAARELALPGAWQFQEAGSRVAEGAAEYLVSWVEAG